MFLRFKKCVCVYVWYTCMWVQVPTETKRVLDLPGVGVKGDSESPDMGAGNKICVLSKHKGS